MMKKSSFLTSLRSSGEVAASPRKNAVHLSAKLALGRGPAKQVGLRGCLAARGLAHSLLILAPTDFLSFSILACCLSGTTGWLLGIVGECCASWADRQEQKASDPDRRERAVLMSLLWMLLPLPRDATKILSDQTPQSDPPTWPEPELSDCGWQKRGPRVWQVP